jgi:3-phosphoshikimate 1-carboxyvinyltransferase
MSKGQYSVLFKKEIKKFNKKIKIPPCKSTSIRAFLIGSISQGISEVKNILESNDVLQLIDCLEKLEVVIKKIKPRHYKIYGKGLGSLYCKKDIILDAQNSGTALRLIASLIATTPNLQVKLKGDKSLNHRNMSELRNIINKIGTS